MGLSMADQQVQNSLLGGFRVLDLTDEKGFLCGKTLADLGADVIKVEKPGGDQARNIGPFYKDIPNREKSLYWFACNLNKRSITLDMETADGHEIFKTLINTADFVIESFDPGYMDELGLGYSELEKINPRVIMTSITPFGQTGPYKDHKASDMILWSMGGVQYSTGEPDFPPLQMSLPQSYFHGGLHAAMGSMMAHYHRQRTGEGQHVDVSIQQAVMLTLMIAAEVWELYGQALKDMAVILPARGGAFRIIPRISSPLKTRMIWPCKDGYIIWSLAVSGGSAGNIASSRALINMMDRNGMAGRLKDYDWAKMDTLTITQEEADDIESIVGKFFLAVAKAEILKEAVKTKVFIAPVFTVKDICEYPHLEARGFWADVAHPELEDIITYPGAFVTIDEAPWKVYHRPPLIGEHNPDIYGKELGFLKDRMVLLKQANVI